MKTNLLLLNLPRIAAAVFLFFLSIVSLRKLSGHDGDLNYIFSGLCFLAALFVAFSKWKVFYIHLIWILFWAVSMHQLYQHYYYYKINCYIISEQNEELREIIRQSEAPKKPELETGQK
jgi:hypothetical protein